MPENALFQKSGPPSLLSLRADSKHNSVTNTFTGNSLKLTHGYLRRFHGENTNPMCDKIDVGMHAAGCTDRISLGLLCAEYHLIWRQSSLTGILATLKEPYLCFLGGVRTYVPWDVSCCLRPRVRGGVCAGEALLAGNRVVDAFGCDVRTFVWKASGAP